MKKMHLFLSVLALLFFFLSCSKSGSDTGSPGSGINCDGTAKTFTGDVNPLVQSFCNQANCHTNGSVNGPGPLTNFTQVFNARVAIRSAISSGFMPRNATLTTAQKTAIICWIDGGAPNN